ncbi:hypothetical protein QBC46DRAFT_401240 [Diplogelasinospora grovesii]|uniref:HNH nuclease domain-containing protein n=1 Tax=Diplogelasinospora grovesii TaxID=303347 RepID=A0AAN6MUM0_9PEZI|nr:hypothetical protein QBC46DRAFT_401240 [Diplogelasinospora grovesii]
MEFPDGWTDPLAALPEIPRHPSISSEDESPLPSVFPSPQLAEDLEGKASRALRNYTPISPTDDTKDVLAIFLEHLSTQGQMVLMAEIDQFAADPPKLRMLRNFLVDAILKPMKLGGGKSPSIEPTPDLEAAQDIGLSMTTIESFRNEQRKMKDDCAKRDDHRCVVTGCVDREHFRELPSGLRQGLTPGELEYAHIFPFALRKFDERGSLETEKKATIWWALHRYFSFIKDGIHAGTINKRENGMTLYHTIHRDFGGFLLALRPLGQDNRYRCHVFDDLGYMASHIPTTVTLVQHDPSVPMPDPNLLRVHFQIAKILHVSGIGLKIDSVWNEDKSWSAYNPNIAPDGSTDISMRFLGSC